MFEKIFQHRVMLSDRVRMKAYRKAIQEVVDKGDVVADIGTGSGILGFLALREGADKVYAIEQNEIVGDAINLARIIGLDKAIVFIKGRSDKVELPEKADVIISELIGFFGLEENLLRFIIDARKRFLKPAGMLVPSWLELYVMPVESKSIWKEIVGIWDKNFYEIDFSPVRNYALSKRYVMDCSKRVSRLSPPVKISHINFYEVEQLPRIFKGNFLCERKGILHGFVGYFRVGLSPHVILSTSFEDPITHWKQTFFPVKEEVEVESGDEIIFDIRTIPRSDNVYWEWKTSIHRKGKRTTGFEQCDLHLSKKEFFMGKTDFIPVLTKEGVIIRRVMELCDGKTNLGNIAEEIGREFPGMYRSNSDALSRIINAISQVVEIE